MKKKLRQGLLAVLGLTLAVLDASATQAQATWFQILPLTNISALTGGFNGSFMSVQMASSLAFTNPANRGTLDGLYQTDPADNANWLMLYHSMLMTAYQSNQPVSIVLSTTSCVGGAAGSSGRPKIIGVIWHH